MQEGQVSHSWDCTNRLLWTWSVSQLSHSFWFPFAPTCMNAHLDLFLSVWLRELLWQVIECFWVIFSCVWLFVTSIPGRGFGMVCHFLLQLLLQTRNWGKQSLVNCPKCLRPDLNSRWLILTPVAMFCPLYHLPTLLLECRTDKKRRKKGSIASCSVFFVQ